MAFGIKRELLTTPLAGIIYLLLITIGVSSVMPFYSNGRRMEPWHGIETMYKGEAKPTFPFAGPGPEHITEMEAPETEGSSPLFMIPANIGGLVGIPPYTSALLAMLGIYILFKVVLNGFELPFDRVKENVKALAFDRSISNDALISRHNTLRIQALLISLAVATAVMLPVPAFVYYNEAGKTVLNWGGLFAPFRVGMILFFMAFAVKHSFGTRPALNELLDRRCPQCFRMDTMSVVASDLLNSEEMTMNKYNQYSNGRRVKTGSYDFTRNRYEMKVQCSECGYWFTYRTTIDENEK